MSSNHGDAEYEQYVRPRVTRRRLAFLMCGDWDRGDDILQRVLTDLYRTWPRARHADSLDGLYIRCSPDGYSTYAG